MAFGEEEILQQQPFTTQHSTTTMTTLKTIFSLIDQFHLPHLMMSMATGEATTPRCWPQQYLPTVPWSWQALAQLY